MFARLKFVLLIALFGTSWGQNIQRVVLYEELDGKGKQLLIEQENAPNLVDKGFDNLAHSVCLTGIWLFYEDIFYNSNGGRGMEYMFGREDFCSNIRTLVKSVSSARLAGNPRDWKESTLTIYQYDYFQGRQYIVFESAPNHRLVGDHQSIIMTGNEAYEIFDGPNFTGESFCLEVPEPGRYTPLLISDLHDLEPGVAHGTIQSVRRTCKSGRKRSIGTFGKKPVPQTVFDHQQYT